jgi:signal transduction histidine kinase/CheY-like chemotaxis protein
MTVDSTQIQYDKEFCYISLVAEMRKPFYNQSEQELIQTFLDAATRFFHLAKAWYGIRIGNTIRPAFHAGIAKDLTDLVQIDLAPSSPEPSEQVFPLVQAVTENHPVSVHFLDQHEKFVTWKAFLDCSKCRSILTIPVEILGKIEAGIVFYSLLPEPFDPSTIDYLDRSVQELGRMISEKRRWSKRLRELRKSKETAEAAALTKTRFLANMSHEIRTPMTAILGFTEMLLRDDLETANPAASYFETLNHYKNTVQIIQSNAEFLLSILNDILDLSKLEANMLRVKKMEVPTDSFLHELLAFYSIQAQAKHLTFSVETLTPLPKYMITDPIRFKQILVNLLGNALKFTSEGEIGLSIAWVPLDKNDSKKRHKKHTSIEGSLFFSVKDTGIGIPQQILSSLFVPFRQAEPGQQFGGSGLGLVISKQLIRLLGGDLIVKSREGYGSTFTVVLPQQFDSNIRFETIKQPMLTGKSVASHFRNENRFQIPASSTSDSVTPHLSTPFCPLAGRRLLLVEDSKDNRRLFSLLIKKAGAEVSEADNGRSAVEIVTENLKNAARFDLILMDMQMPILDGYAATRQLREMGYTDPIIALTAHAFSEERQKCLDAGCNDYAIKPILRDALIAVILKNLKQ